jgi:hypothetical protein
VLVPPAGIPGAFERARRLTASARCRVIRLCPGGHRYPLADWVLSPVPELCERERIAVSLDFASERVNWAETVAFARGYSPVPRDEERTAIVSGNEQALQDGTYTETWL